MISGQFEVEYPNGDAHILSNQFTNYGMQALLKAAFWNSRPPWFVGLCARNPGDFVALSDMEEPTVADGYARIPLPLSQGNWPKIGVLNGETYVESYQFTFPISDALDTSVNRLFLTDGTYVIAISSAFPGGFVILDAPLVTRYRLFFR
jgi:hypothetical protein